jgi:hypothetical protein
VIREASHEKLQQVSGILGSRIWQLVVANQDSRRAGLEKGLMHLADAVDEACGIVRAPPERREVFGRAGIGRAESRLASF